MDDFENAAAAGENTGGKFVQALPPARRERIPAPAANGHNRPAHRLEIARPYPYNNEKAVLLKFAPLHRCG